MRPGKHDTSINRFSLSLFCPSREWRHRIHDMHILLLGPQRSPQGTCDVAKRDTFRRRKPIDIVNDQRPTVPIFPKKTRRDIAPSLSSAQNARGISNTLACCRVFGFLNPCRAEHGCWGSRKASNRVCVCTHTSNYVLWQDSAGKVAAKAASSDSSLCEEQHT